MLPDAAMALTEPLAVPVHVVLNAPVAGSKTAMLPAGCEAPSVSTTAVKVPPT